MADAQKPVSTKKDGGVWALAGYLYQVVGMLGITARLIQGSKKMDAQGDLDAIFGLSNVGRSIGAHHESYQQDALLRAIGLTQSDVAAFIQFKYSSDPAKKITGTDLGEIIAGFDESTQNAQSEGQSITACVLITNREFTAPAEKLWESSNKSKSYRLERILGWNGTDSIEELLCFGRKFGALDSEIETGISQLVGEVLRRTNGDTPLGSPAIQEADFIRAFTGHRDARRLSQESVFPICSEEVHEHAARVGLFNSFVERVVSKDLMIASHNNALIVLYGHGGIGKTVVLWKWASELAQIKSFESASELNCIPPSDWIVDKICNWAQLPPGHERRSKSIEDGLERLHIANPSQPLPILYLGLDGLDEDIRHDIRGAIKQTIGWFIKEDDRAKKGSPPRAALVVTCRDFQEFTEEWMPKDFSGGFGQLPIVAHVAVNDFSHEEILDALNNNFFEACISKRIMKAIEISSNFLPPQGLSLRLDPTVAAADLNMLEALRQPIVWRIFAEFDLQKQNAFLDCDPNALSDLTRIFLNRFCTKVVDRNKVPGLDRKNEILAILCKIGSHCAQANTNTYFKKVDDWCKPACETGVVNDAQANRLHKEALSAGLIHQERLQWQWAYDWLLNYLSQEESVQ